MKKKSHRLIAEVHQVNKEMEAVKSNVQIADSDRTQRLSQLSRQMDEVKLFSAVGAVLQSVTNHSLGSNCSLNPSTITIWRIVVFTAWRD